MISVRSLLILSVLVLSSARLVAQWRIVTPAPVPTRTAIEQGGAIHYSDGMLWAGYGGLSKSSDLGKTWTPTALSPTVQISDIAFYDEDNGVVAAYDGIYRTSDHGATWQQTTSGRPFFRIAYNHSKNILHASEYASGDLVTSLDGGLTWTHQHVTQLVWGFTIAKDGSIYVIGAINPVGNDGYLFRSTDLGNSWQQLPGNFDKDSYTVEIDSCDPSTMYIANDDYFMFDDGRAALYVSKDAGTSWSKTYTQNRRYLSGAMAVSGHAVFAGTTLSGELLRSTDKGANWVNIGGAATLGDSRSICALDDNHLFVLDTLGNIWATDNSGGSIVSGFSSLTANPTTLFDNDIVTCGNHIRRTILLTGTGCVPPKIWSYAFSGSDSNSYHILSINDDSIVVEFTSLHTDAQPAQLILTLGDDSKLPISLNGSGSHGYPLAMKTVDEKSDTLGGMVTVPVTIAGLVQPEDVEIVMHYTSDLQYQGSNDIIGANVDMPGEAWQGRAKLRIIMAQSTSPAAFAHFLTYADSSPTTKVWFDSLVILRDPCTYNFRDTIVTSHITSPAGCASRILSQVMLGQAVSFDIRPNPTSGEITIESPLELGDVTIETYDALGTKRATNVVTLHKGVASPLFLPEPIGTYYLRISSAFGTASSRIVIAR